MLGWDIVLGMGLGSDLNDKTVVRLLHPFICTKIENDGIAFVGLGLG
jgi:hypothetical protein